MDAPQLAAGLTLTPDGLIPAIVQQHDTGEVLMLAWMSPDTLAETLALGETVFWSRSRGERWHKGASSGNTQRVVGVDLDCDGDVLLIQVDQSDGVACHTGDRTCFKPLATRLADQPPDQQPDPQSDRHVQETVADQGA